MRAPLAATLLGLALVVGGCGGAGARSTSGADLGTDAAKLVPAGALAFVSVDTDESSQQWRQLDRLTSGLPLRTQLLDKLRAALAKHGLDYATDVKPALGPELDVAVLKSENGRPEAVALARPGDESKLGALATKLDHGDVHYTVKKVGDWSVVAASPEAFAAIRAANAGTSLAETSGFAAARQALGGDALARVFANGRALAQLPQLVALAGTSAPEWLTATLAANTDALQVKVAGAPTTAEATTGTSLLRDVPSGAILAVSFRGSAQAATRLRGLAGPLSPSLGIAPNVLASLGSGDGVLYLRAGGLIPVFAVELRPRDPQTALTALRGIAARIGKRAGGAITLIVKRQGGRLYLTDSESAIAELRGSGRKLVDDAAFKDALAAAAAPANPNLLVYADGPQLLPLAQAAAPLLGGHALPAAVSGTLEHIGTVIAAAANEPSGLRATLHIELKQ